MGGRGGGFANISKNKKLGWCTNIGIVVIAINTVHLTLRPIIFHFFLFAPISFAICVVERYKVLNRQRAQGTCKRTLFYSREIKFHEPDLSVRRGIRNAVDYGFVCD